MGNIENTAINQLIQRASGGPRPTSRRIAVAPPPADLPVGDEPMHARLPAKMPVAAPFETTMPMPYPMVLRGGRPVAAPPRDGRAAVEPAWGPPGGSGGPAGPGRIDPRRLHELMHEPDQERMVPTFQMRRRPSEVRSVVSRRVFPIALLVSTGIVIGAYVAFGDHGMGRGEIAAAEPARLALVPPEAPAAPTPESAAADPALAAAAVPVAGAPPPTAAPAPEPAAVEAPALVDVRIESIPSGATVTLVDHGRTQLVGDTPIDTAVDPSRPYDLVFTYADRPPHLEHLDPRATRRISASLDAHEPAPHPAEAAPRRVERAGSEPAATRTSRAHADASAGEGKLMISSKPPCEIAIDGRSTGLTTPQRAIALPAGRHRITLVNSEKAIRKTLTVRIAADTTEKVIEDLMK